MVHVHIMCTFLYHDTMSSSSFSPHHSLPFPDTGSSATSEAWISGDVNTPAIVHDQAPHLHAHDVLGIDQLFSIPLWMLPTPEDYSIVYDVIYAVRHFYIPDEPSNAGLISQMVSRAITFITNDPSSRDYYYCLTINQLHAHYAQWSELGNIPLETTATGITAPASLLSTSSSPSRPQDRVHSLPTTTPEDLERCIVTLVAQLVSQSCIHQGGLENIDLVSQVIRWAVSRVADDDFFREYYFNLTIQQLYPHSTSSYHTTSPAAAEIATPAPPLSAPSPSPQPQETVHSPATANEVSSNEIIHRLTCDYCQRHFSRRDSLQRHLLNACTYTREQHSYAQHVFAIGQ